MLFVTWFLVWGGGPNTGAVFFPPVLAHFFDHAPRNLWPALAITEHKASTRAAIERLFLERGYLSVLANADNLGFRRQDAAS